MASSFQPLICLKWKLKFLCLDLTVFKRKKEPYERIPACFFFFCPLFLTEKKAPRLFCLTACPALSILLYKYCIGPSHASLLITWNTSWRLKLRFLLCSFFLSWLGVFFESSSTAGLKGKSRCSLSSESFLPENCFFVFFFSPRVLCVYLFF